MRWTGACTDAARSVHSAFKATRVSCGVQRQTWQGPRALCFRSGDRETVLKKIRILPNTLVGWGCVVTAAAVFCDGSCMVVIFLARCGLFLSRNMTMQRAFDDYARMT